MRSTYALLGAGLLQDADAPQPQPVVQSETGTFLLSSLQKQPQPSGREVVKREVHQELTESSRVDRDGLARARPDDRRRRAAAHPRAEDGPLPRAVRGRTAGRLAARRRRDRDRPPGLGAAHRAQGGRGARRTRRGPKPKSAAAESGRGCAAMAATAPSRHGDAGRRHGRLGRPRCPGPRRAADGREAGPPPSSQPPRSLNPDQSMRMAPPGSSSFEGAALVEHLLMEGEVRMTVADYANAVTVYSKLVDIEPRVAAYHMRLATAMVCYPQDGQARRARVLRGCPPRARQPRHPLQVGPLLQDDEGEEPGRRGVPQRRAAQPAPRLRAHGAGGCSRRRTRRSLP